MILREIYPVEYAAWCAAKRRCHNRWDPKWKDYGGRGITVCEEWRGNFAAFLVHIGPKPLPKLSLDRINNDLGYQPGNVRWATIQQQANNRRVPKPAKYYVDPDVAPGRKPKIKVKIRLMYDTDVTVPKDPS